MKCLTPSDILSGNMTALRAHYPDLCDRIEALPDRDQVQVVPAADGGVAYAVRKDGRLHPLTDTRSPTARIQQAIRQSARHLGSFSQPVLIVGTCPGNELLYCFDLCEQAPQPRPDQPVYVCIDSLYTFYGFLQTWDARRVITASRVHLFHHTQTAEVLDDLNVHPEKSYSFTLVTGAPQQVLDQVMPPFVQFMQQRDQELGTLTAENTAYYEQLTDDKLLAVLQGRAGRSPRILMPTCSWSTFVQHSTRDLARAFEQGGWESRVLRTPGMLTTYYLARMIHAFKPDLLLFIDHLRFEAEAAYPPNLMFVTWVQDEMDHIFARQAGTQLRAYAAARNRDLVLGYVDKLLDDRFDYPRDRLRKVNVPVNREMFRPIRSADDGQPGYACELSFVSNVSTPVEQIVEQQIIPELLEWNVPTEWVGAAHDALRRHYRAGKTLVSSQQFFRFLEEHTAFGDCCRQLDAEQRGRLYTLLYWRLNDTLYRHTVLEWAIEAGIDLHLYGQGWERHPQFAPCAQGHVPHGETLSRVYQGAQWNLHLNITEGMHQRVWEILASGARPLFRQREQARVTEPDPAHMHRLAECILSDPFGHRFEDELAELTGQPEIYDWALRKVSALTRSAPRSDGNTSRRGARAAVEYLKSAILARPDWMIPPDRYVVFDGPQSLREVIRSHREAPGHGKPVQTLEYAHVVQDITRAVTDLLDDGARAAAPPPSPAQRKLQALMECAAHIRAIEQGRASERQREACAEYGRSDLPGPARIRLAEALVKQGRIKAAAGLIGSDETYFSSDLAIRLARVLVFTDRPQDAATLLQSLPDMHRDDQWYDVASLCAWRRGDLEAACRFSERPEATGRNPLADLARAGNTLRQLVEHTGREAYARHAERLLSHAASCHPSHPIHLQCDEDAPLIRGLYFITQEARRAGTGHALQPLAPFTRGGERIASPTLQQLLGLIHADIGHPGQAMQLLQRCRGRTENENNTSRYLARVFLSLWRLEDVRKLLDDTARPATGKFWHGFYLLLFRLFAGNTLRMEEITGVLPARARAQARLPAAFVLAESGFQEQAWEWVRACPASPVQQLYELVLLQKKGRAAARCRDMNIREDIFDQPDALQELVQGLTAHEPPAPVFDLWNNLLTARLFDPDTPLPTLMQTWFAQHIAAWKQEPEGGFLPDRLELCI